MSISPPISIPAAPAFGSFRDWGRASRASEPDSIRPDGILSASLRANGSRECAPDDRLREAIRSDTGRLDCFVADAPKKKQTDKLLILFNVMDEPPPSVLFHPRGSAKGRCGTRNDGSMNGESNALA